MKQLDPHKDLQGIITVLNTPFGADGGVDLDALAAHVRYASDAGVAGFLVPAKAAEVEKLTEAERMAMLETVVKAAGDVPVVAGVSSEDATLRLRLTRHAIAAGAAGILVAPASREEDVVQAAMTELAELCPGFLMLQDWEFQGPGLPVDLIARLFDEIPLFRCLKIEVAAAGPKYSAVLAATAGQLHVSGGWAVIQLYEALERGVHAFMPTGLHYTYCRIYQLYETGKKDEARALFERLLPILAFSNQHLDISVHFFKRLLHRQGIYPTAAVRKPILPFDETHEAVAAPLIERAIALENECRQAMAAD